jgi:hypothetical protein
VLFCCNALVALWPITTDVAAQANVGFRGYSGHRAKGRPSASVANDPFRSLAVKFVVMHNTAPSTMCAANNMAPVTLGYFNCGTSRTISFGALLPRKLVMIRSGFCALRGTDVCTAMGGIIFGVAREKSDAQISRRWNIRCHLYCASTARLSRSSYHEYTGRRGHAIGWGHSGQHACCCTKGATNGQFCPQGETVS